jgi:type IV secretion system protein VirB11
MTAGVYLKAYLGPLARWLDSPEITDVMINRPGELWTDGAAGLQRWDAPDIDDEGLGRLSRQVAAHSSQGVSREHPLLASVLPDGSRIQVITPPATRGHIAVAVRKHTLEDLTLSDFRARGMFSRLASASERLEQRQRLHSVLEEGRSAEFLQLAVRSGCNIVISGGTGAGKTTFLNALLKEIPADERIIVIEDTPELNLSHPNAVGLVAVDSALGEASVGVGDLLRAALRMRPDRLLVGEIRGPEAFSFLRAVNTGHPGSLTTVHADSPEGAIEQIALMTLQAGLSISRSDIVAYTRSVLDVIVQVSRRNGARFVESIVYPVL